MSFVRHLGSRRFWLLLTISGAGLALFVTQMDFSAMGKSFAEGNLGLVTVSASTYMTAYVIRSGRWRVLFAHIHDCGAWRPFHALSIAMLTNNVLPVKAGVAARVHLVSSRTPISHAAVGSSLIVGGLFDGLIMLGLVLIAIAVVPLDGTVQAAAIGLAVSMTATSLIVGLVVSGRVPTGPLTAIAMKVPGRAVRFLRETGAALMEGLGAVRHPGLAASALSASLMYWLMLGTTYVLLGQAFHLQMGLVEYVAVLALVQLAIGTPSARGGSGTFQMVMAQALASMGGAAGA